MISGWAFLPLGLVAAVIAVGVGVYRGSPASLVFVQLVAIAHVAAVAGLTLSPIPVDPTQIAHLRATGLADDPGYVNLRPFATIGPSVRELLRYGLIGSPARNLLANLALLMPLAWYGPRLWPRLRQPGWFAVAAVLASTSIELAQRLLTVRLGYPHSTDVDDVIVNAGGAITAFIALWLAGRLIAGSRRAGPDEANE